MDIANFFKGKVKAGQADLIAADNLSRVRYDGTTFYYETEGLNITKDEFLNFICSAWEVDPEQVDCGIWDKKSGSFSADVE
jgi:hypothetical protein